ncbi:MAG: hypothetical protein ACJA2X_002354 [Halocynthiibacter sp.]|jgi:hypothetical protein
MTAARTARPAPTPAIVRRIMAKHGLSQPSARALAVLLSPKVSPYGW